MSVRRVLTCAALAAGVSALAIGHEAAGPGAGLRRRAGTWKSLGCYSDNVSGRALPSSESVTGGSAAMTNELCQAACGAAGFSMAGTEYGGECWCGNAIGNGGAAASDGCNAPCNGDSSETCGGSNRLTVSQLSSSTGGGGGGSGGSGGNTSAPTGKRGLAYNNDNPNKDAGFANLFVGYPAVSWAYDWGFPKWNLDDSFEFVPMLWGLPSGDDPDWTAAVQSAGVKNILGFNEPDLTYSASSNILPAAAAAGYQAYMQPFASQVRIGTPSVLWNNVGSSSGGAYDTEVWTQYFMGNCTGCHFDFAAIHWYQDCEPGNGEDGADWFTGNVTDAHSKLGLPVWVTEFQCYGSEDQQVTFLQKVMPWMDQQDYVERYAYFGVFPDYLVDDAGDALSALGTAYATT